MSSGDLNPGVVMLGHAVGHAAFLYGDDSCDYDDIIATATRGHRAAPRITPPSAYVIGRTHELITQASSGQLDHDDISKARWIGAATTILRELTRDA